MKRPILATIALAFIALTSACVPGPPNPGFRVETTIKQIGPMGLPVIVSHAGVGLRGSFISANGSTTGNVLNFIGNSGFGARYDVRGGRAPATWSLGETSGPCAGQNIPINVSPGGRAGLLCDTFAFRFRFTASPETIDADNPPSSITVAGDGLSTWGGMPYVEYYDYYGTLVGTAQATSVSPDGTSMVGAAPSFSSIYSGGYILRVYNPDGSYLGEGWGEVYRFYDPPPPPEYEPNPGGCGSYDPRMDQPVCEFNNY